MKIPVAGMIKIAIASGKGGTGKTFVAVNMVYVLRQNGYRVLLVDCDAEAPNSLLFFKTRMVLQTEISHLVPVIDTGKCTFCSKCHDYCNYNAILILPPAKFIKVIEDLCHGCGACSVACSYNAISGKAFSLGMVTQLADNQNNRFSEARMNTGIMSPVPVIKAAIKQIYPDEEIVILDSPPGTSCPFIQTVATADYVVLVTEPTPFGLSDLRNSVETLRKMGKKFGVVVNRAGLGNDEVHCYLKNEGIELLFEIPFKKEYSRLSSEGRIVAMEDRKFADNLLMATEILISDNGTGSYKR